MADQEGKKGRGVPVSALVVVIIVGLILAIVLVVVWIQLQSCIAEQRNNICPNINADPNNL